MYCLQRCRINEVWRICLLITQLKRKKAASMPNKTYIAIDLKSFYDSVERGLDALNDVLEDIKHE